MEPIIKKGSSAEQVHKKVNKLLKKHKNKGIKDLCGSIQLEKDPVVLQKKWRDEWE